MKFFNQRRILIREIVEKQIIATLVEEEYINNPSIINVIETQNTLVNIKFLLSLLNSSLYGWYHYNTSPKAKKVCFPKY